MTLLAAPEAVQRLRENEERFDTFVNLDATYTTNTGVQVDSVRKLVTTINAAKVAAEVSISDDVLAVNIARSTAEELIETDIQEVETRKNYAINTEIPAAIATLVAITNRGEWMPGTTYNANNKEIVSVTGSSVVWYICVASHTSSSIFATDEPSKWRVYQNYNPADPFTTATIYVDYLSDINITFPPTLSAGGNLIIDGDIMGTDFRIFLSKQTNAVENGSYVYTVSGNSLVRTTDMAAGQRIGKPFIVTITSGELYQDTSLSLTSPQTALIGTDPSTWGDNSAGAYPAGASLAGPASPNDPATPTIRRLSAWDLPLIKTIITSREWGHGIPELLGKTAYISNYILATSPFTHTSAVNTAIKENNTIIFDRMLNLYGQVTADLNGKRLVFLGSGQNGPCKIVCMNGNSFLDISGVHDLVISGDCFGEQIANIGGSSKFIKSSTPCKNIKIERLVTKWFPTALSIGAAVDGLIVGSIGVFDLATELPLNITASAAASNGVKTHIGRIENKPTRQVLSANTSITYKVAEYCEVLELTGATANRNITLSLENVWEGAPALIRNTSGGAFSYVIIDGATSATLKTIANGQSARCYVSSGAWYLKE